MKSKGVYACPDDSNPIQEWSPAQDGADAAGAPVLPQCYMPNYQMFDTSFGAPHIVGFINEPASKIMLAEAFFTNNGDVGLGWDNWAKGYGGAGNWATLGSAPHTGMWNLVFLDGHVKTMRPTATVNGQVNMWGTFDDVSNSPGCPQAPVNDMGWQGAINCNAPSPAAAADLATLEQKYP